ncbi:MAG: glycosyltransferase [Gammaproteobacteria bacterium]|nr:glycosyltransferase [Gammaproteobacteria bacterium]
MPIGLSYINCMDVVLITLGSRGDINPFIGLGLALKQRGHQVTIMSYEHYADLAIEVGLNFLSCSSSVTYQKLIRHPDTAHPVRIIKLFGTMVIEPMREVYRLLSTHFDPQTTVIGAQYPLVVGARLAQEKLGFRMANICLQPSTLFSAIEPARLAMLPEWFYKLPVGAKKKIQSMILYFINSQLNSPLNQFRQELSLPKIKHIYQMWLPSPELMIGLFPEWFAPIPADWPAQIKLTGFINYSGKTEPLSATLLGFLEAGKPPLVFTCGTYMTKGNDFFSTSIRVAAELGERALLLTPYPEQLPRTLPQTILHVDYAPFDLLLPKISALIHHGGIGTLAQAIAHHVPQLIVPSTADQFDNAYRLEKLGCSTTLLPNHYQQAQVVAKIKFLLNHTQQVSDQKYPIDFISALNATCQYFESLASKAE